MAPSEPEIVLELVEATCDPSDTLPVGALIDSPPAVSVKATGVPAPADNAVVVASIAKLIPRNKSLRIMSRPFSDVRAEAGRALALAYLIGIGPARLKGAHVLRPSRR